jgi:hypothetical protein
MRRRVWLTRQDLHEIGVRRRGDRDVKALLWEVKRLRDLLVTVHGLAAQLRADEPVHRDYYLWQLENVFEGERHRFDAVPAKAVRPGGGKPERGDVKHYARRRLEQVEEESGSTERRAKKEARARRG